jgi:CheY-like chemotaxis protein
VKPKILIVEDSDHIRRILSHIITNAGAETVEVEDGQAAMDRIREGLRPAAIVLDITTPRIDGYGVMRQLQDNPAWKKIPVVVCSARNQPEDIQKAKAAGAVEYVVKPNVTKETIIPALMKAMGVKPKPKPPTPEA